MATPREELEAFRAAKAARESGNKRAELDAFRALKSAQQGESFTEGVIGAAGELAFDLPAKAIGGVAGFLASPFGGDGNGAQVSESVKQAIKQFFPNADNRTSEEILKKLGENIVGGIKAVTPDIIERAAISGAKGAVDIGTGITDAIADVSPLAATVVSTPFKAAPDIVGLVTGAAGLTRASKLTTGFKGGVENTIRTLSGNPDIKVFEDVGTVSQASRDALTPSEPTSLFETLTPEARDVLQGAKDSGIDVNKIAANELKASGVELSPKMLDNFDLFKKHDVPITQANVTQDIDDWRFQQDAIKKSGVVANVMINQDARLAQLAREGKDRLGPTATDKVQTNDSIITTIQDLAETLDNAVGDAYTAAREIAPTEKLVKLDNLVNELNANLKSSHRQERVPQEIRKLLIEEGVLSKDGKSVQGRLSVTDTESLVRQHLNSIYGNSKEPATRSLISDLKSALDDDVANAFPVDVFANARQSKIDFHKAVGRDKTNKFEAKTRSVIEDILSGKIEDPVKMLSSSSVKGPELSDAKDFFLQRSGDAGINAWGNFKAQIIQDAIDKAKGQPIGAQSGQQVTSFKGPSFEAEFKRLKDLRGAKGESRFDTIFEPDEREFINDIINISSLRRPAAQVGLGSGPSGLAVGELTGNLVEMYIDAQTLGTAGKMAKKAGGLATQLVDRKGKAFVQPEKLIEKQVKEAVKRDK